MSTKSKCAIVASLFIAGGGWFLLSIPESLAAEPNLVLNPSVESTTANVPTNWLKDRWGSNTAVFSYKPTGYDSGNSIYITLTKWVSGDAKWYFEPVAVNANSDYVFTDYYQSNVVTNVVAMSLDAQNKPTYFNIKTNLPASSAGWTKFSATVHTLSTTKKLTIFHLIKKTGWLQTDDFSLVAFGTPICSSFIYSGWGDCQTNGTKTRTVLTSLPAGCSGGAPVLSQDCTYVPPVCTAFTYSNWNVCQSNNTQTRTVLTGSPAGCSGGTPVLSQSCTYVPPVVIEEYVPNYSLETVSANKANLPAQWSHSKWGSNTATYQYLQEGHDGSRSVKVTVSKYVSGDAKWIYAPQSLARGKDFKFTAWYKTNTIPHVVAQYIRDNGTEDYYGMQDPIPAGTDWQQYTDVFSVPLDVKSVSIFFFVSNNGWVQTDDYHITSYQYAGFNRGLVSLTFDDGYEENVTSVLPVMDQYGFKVTQCGATMFAEGQPSQEAYIKQFAAAGHEICSHTVNHPFLTQLTTAEIDYELSHAQSYLQQLTGQPVANFASPYGDYNAAVNTEIKKYYTSHRTTDEGFNSKDSFDPYRLRVQNMTNTTTLSQYQEWVNKAIADRTWLILIYHVVGTGNLSEFDTKKTDFDAQMSWLAGSGITVERWDSALSEVTSQLP